MAIQTKNYKDRHHENTVIVHNSKFTVEDVNAIRKYFDDVLIPKMHIHFTKHSCMNATTQGRSLLIGANDVLKMLQDTNNVVEIQIRGHHAPVFLLRSNCSMCIDLVVALSVNGTVVTYYGNSMWQKHPNRVTKYDVDGGCVRKMLEQYSGYKLAL